jgi:hypothetical protein
MSLQEQSADAPRDRSLYLTGYRHKRYKEGEPPQDMTEWERWQWDDGVLAAEACERL